MKLKCSMFTPGMIEERWNDSFKRTNSFLIEGIFSVYHFSPSQSNFPAHIPLPTCNPVRPHPTPLKWANIIMGVDRNYLPLKEKHQIRNSNSSNLAEQLLFLLMFGDNPIPTFHPSIHFIEYLWREFCLFALPTAWQLTTFMFITYSCIPLPFLKVLFERVCWNYDATRQNLVKSVFSFLISLQSTENFLCTRFQGHFPSILHHHSQQNKFPSTLSVAIFL